MAVRLSHFTGIAKMDVMVNSCKSLLSQESSATNLLRLLYSASAKDKETVTCFLDFQAIKVSPKNTTKPLTDFRV